MVWGICCGLRPGGLATSCDACTVVPPAYYSLQQQVLSEDIPSALRAASTLCTSKCKMLESVARLGRTLCAMLWPTVLNLGFSHSRSWLTPGLKSLKMLLSRPGWLSGIPSSALLLAACPRSLLTDGCKG